MTARNRAFRPDDRRVEQLLAELRRIHRERERMGPSDTLEACRALLARARPLGIQSSDLLLLAANAAYHGGEIAAGLDYCLRAVAIDPLSPVLRDALAFHVAQAQEALAAKDRASDDPSTPALHALLVRAGRADAASHVAMARHLWHQGRRAAARTLVEAVTSLAPHSSEAWALRGELAVAAGDVVTAEHCRAACAAAGADGAEPALPSFLPTTVAQA